MYIIFWKDDYKNIAPPLPPRKTQFHIKFINNDLMTKISIGTTLNPNPSGKNISGSLLKYVIAVFSQKAISSCMYIHVCTAQNIILSFWIKVITFFLNRYRFHQTGNQNQLYFFLNLDKSKWGKGIQQFKHV